MINNINFIGNQLKKFITSQKYCSDINEYHREIVINGINKNKKTPLILCKIDTRAGTGNLIVNKLRFLIFFG
jgi:hypothetical protein